MCTERRNFAMHLAKIDSMFGHHVPDDHWIIVSVVAFPLNESTDCSGQPWWFSQGLEPWTILLRQWVDLWIVGKDPHWKWPSRLPPNPFSRNGVKWFWHLKFLNDYVVTTSFLAAAQRNCKRIFKIGIAVITWKLGCRMSDSSSSWSRSPPNVIVCTFKKHNYDLALHCLGRWSQFKDCWNA